MSNELKFTWVESYTAIAKALTKMRDQESFLFNICSRHADMGNTERIDPFTFMAVFNRQISDKNRSVIIADILSELKIDAPIPQDFCGIPFSNNLKWRYMDGIDSHIDSKWDFFECAMNFAHGKTNESQFSSLFDSVLSQKNIGIAKLTIALYWCCPDKFLPLDKNTSNYLRDSYYLTPEKNRNGKDYINLLYEVKKKTALSFKEISAYAYEYDEWAPPLSIFDPGISQKDWSNLISDTEVFTTTALDMLSKMIDFGGQATCKELSESYGNNPDYYNAVGRSLGEQVAKKLNITPRKNRENGNQYWSIPFLGKKAEQNQSGDFVWKIRPELLLALNEVIKTLPNPIPISPDKPNYWLITPGEDAWAWKEFRDEGIAAIGWDFLGDLSQYSSKAEIAAAINKKKGTDGSCKNDASACFLFNNAIKPGDILYAKTSTSTLLGKGTVTSTARFDNSRKKYKHIISVDWNTVGEWTVSEFNLPTKTLTAYNHKHEALDEIIENGGSSFHTEENKLAVSGWWLTANPKIWSFNDITEKEEQYYTLHNEKGNPRRIYKNFIDAKPGDIVIGYEANPTKAIVSICEISREHDDEKMYFKKIRDLKNPIPLEQIKTMSELSNMEFLKNPNGSFFKLNEAELNIINNLIYEEDDSAAPSDISIEPYNDTQFLNEVYIAQDQYEELKGLVLEKKNIILQGAPGTGKTFAAERLAWALMGNKDKNRIEKVQFHQNTSYDEFVIGFRPNTEGGFFIEEGPFVRFCNKAANDKSGAEYFFIIDEINRANVSKVFGELLMLIEDSHRGESLRLGIDGRKFSVPENLTIIGMMNTADRGLAFIDYALRRRFAFFEMQPSLENENFKKRVNSCEDKRMPALIEAVKALNKRIAEDPALGDGFRIGHSYFCRKKENEVGCVNSIIKYELIPLIKEYWFDDHETVIKEINKLEAIL